MASKKKSVHPYPQQLEWYEKLIATHPGIERKGDTMPYTSLNGHMTSYLSRDGVMALRLPEDKREAFIKKYKTGLMKAYGIIQKEYVEVPGDLLKKTSEMKPWFYSGYEYVKSMKPKPPAKKNK